MKASKRSSIYVPAPTNRDLSDLERYGDIKYLSDKPLHRHAIDSMESLFSERLRDSEPGDYILVSALSIMSMVAAIVFYDMHGRVNLILHDHGDRYVDRSFSSVSRG